MPMAMRGISPSTTLLPLVGAAMIIVTGTRSYGADVGQWHRFELVSTDGAAGYAESDLNPNPFLDRRLTCEFTAPSGSSTYRVQGFFNTDNVGSSSGNKFVCRFSPNSRARGVIPHRFARAPTLRSRPARRPVPSATKVLTDSDFDRLSRHDCHIWAIELRPGDPETGDWTSDSNSTSISSPNGTVFPKAVASFASRRPISSFTA